MIICGNAQIKLKKVRPESINCCITSPPYWGLRDYGVEGQLGLEKTPEEYVNTIVKIFRLVREALRPDGTLWLNLGDSYVSGKSRYSSCTQTISGKNRGEPRENKKPDLYYHPYLKDKDLCGIPWRVALALQADGWYLRQDIIWHKPNPMPESVTDRCTKAHEYIFLLSKNSKYYFDHEAIKEPMVEYERERRLRERSQGLKRAPLKLARDGKTGFSDQSSTGAVRNLDKIHDLAERGMRNKRSVWTVSTKPFKGAHFATFPEDLILPCVLAGCPQGG